MKGSGTGYLVKTGIKSIWQNKLMSLASIAVLSACLMILGVAALFSVNMGEALAYVESQNEIVVFIAEEATDEEMVRVCKLAQADPFIQEFPDKYDTHIEQGGSNVSGGQKQRLCIARAMLRKPAILILDDSTSAVDSATEAAIRQSFAENLKDTTVIIIAQRISSVQYADEILILDDDHIAGRGTHEELLANNTIYQEIYQSQQEGVGG